MTPAVEYRVRLGSTGMWHVDYHHGTYADTRATFTTREEAEADADARRSDPSQQVPHNNAGAENRPLPK